VGAVTCVRPDAVAFLADAFRNQGRSRLADLVLANAHLDYTRAERRSALLEVLDESRTRLVALEAERAVVKEFEDVWDDPPEVRGRLLLQLPDDELEHLHRVGALDDWLAELGIDLDKEVGES
jgi:hypothetical protein